MNTPWIFKDTSPEVIARRLGMQFDILSFKMRSLRTGYYHNVSIEYDSDADTYGVVLRTCGKYPKYHSQSPVFHSLRDCLNWLAHYDDSV